MVIGILQFDVFIDGARSLKDKRRVVVSLKDRLHREHLCSIAEVGDPDRLNHARLGLALVGRDGGHVGKTLDRICAKLRALTDAEVGDIDRQVIGAEGVVELGDDDASATDGLRDELLARASQPDLSDGGPHP